MFFCLFVIINYVMLLWRFPVLLDYRTRYANGGPILFQPWINKGSQYVLDGCDVGLT